MFKLLCTADSAAEPAERERERERERDEPVAQDRLVAAAARLVTPGTKLSDELMICAEIKHWL